MKPLRNPIVVGILVLAAAALVFRNALTPLWQRLRSPRTQAVAPVSAPLTNTTADQVFAITNAASVVTNAPERTEAWNRIEVVKDWTRAPRRDPFLFIPLAQPYLT